MLKRNVKGVLKTEDEMFMRRVCGVMDTNSFESAVVRDNSSTSLRALFPLGALTNHQCIPNTRHIVDSKGELYVYSTTSIAKGEEITMTYTDVLWDTLMRRKFLRATKHFCCCCTRCSDVTECGSLLGALYCAEDQCFGNLLPDDPLCFNSAWTCNECGLVIKNKQISSIRAGIAAAIEEVLYTNPRRILRFIQRELSVLIPATNYVTMEMLFRVVSLFGRVNGFTWQELSDEDLNIKIQFCNTLIECLEKLNCGDYTKKGINDNVSEFFFLSINVSILVQLMLYL
ncbi:PREDICTED: protein msta, isoform A [Ceratosolen solmsi marchali]|uniref:Protein msta, isoform A n=1 Tax=Ceratosolen solmsi marchali TaxID=326594 RepID=A0AAJ6YXD7_9HYME|nr:PREDICTED: protein msta, isoform A [Ceratosolen solmsi marchali]